MAGHSRCTRQARDSKPILLSANDTRWGSYDLITPGRAEGTNFPTLWARYKADGTLRAFPVKGTAQAPDLTGFTDPGAGATIGQVDPKTFPRIGSDGDLTGDGIPDLWAVDANQQLVAFNGIGTRPDPDRVPYPTLTGIDPTPVALGNLNMPKAQWLLTGETDSTTPSTVGNFPATVTGITWPTATISGRSTNYAAFAGPSSLITAPDPVIDTRKSFTISTTALVTKAGGVVLSQDLTRGSSLLLFPNHHKNTWEFSLANADADGMPYDTTTETNTAVGIAFNTWTQLTAVYDHTTGQMRLYVNGTLAATGHHSASTSPAPVGPLTLGRFKQAAAYAPSGLTGGISNLAVYPYAASVTAPETMRHDQPDRRRSATASTTTGTTPTTATGSRSPTATARTPRSSRSAMTAPSEPTANASTPPPCGTANTTLIELRSCDSSAPSQQFLPRADGSIHNPVSGRCLDLGNYDTTPGTPLWLYDCNRSPAQSWTIPTLGTAPLPVPTP